MEVSVRTARQELAELINRAHYRHEHIIIVRHGKPVAALIAVDQLRTYQAAEGRGDAQDTVDDDLARDSPGVPLAEVRAERRAARQKGGPHD
jgi:prevent-host-death family protein